MDTPTTSIWELFVKLLGGTKPTETHRVSNPWVGSPINVAADTRTSDHLAARYINGSQISYWKWRISSKSRVRQNFASIDDSRLKHLHFTRPNWGGCSLMWKPLLSPMIWLRSVTGFLKIRKLFLESLKIFIQGNSITMIVTTKPNPPSKRWIFWTLKNVTIQNERVLYGLGQNGRKCLFGKNEEAHSPRWMTKDTSSFYINDKFMKMNNLDELRLFDVFQVFHHFMKLLLSDELSF